MVHAGKPRAATQTHKMVYVKDFNTCPKPQHERAFSKMVFHSTAKPKQPEGPAPASAPGSPPQRGGSALLQGRSLPLPALHGGYILLHREAQPGSCFCKCLLKQIAVCSIGLVL